MILNGVEFREKLGNRLNWQIKCDNLGHFNLLIGDNAQGKTRLFNFMRFVRDINLGFRPPLNPSWTIDSQFRFTDNRDQVKYDLVLEISPDGTQLLFNETIMRNNEILFSRKDPTLLDEKNGNIIKDFFIPNNLSALFALTGEEFGTIGLLRSFIERMLFLEENRFSSTNYALGGNALVIDRVGSNIADVLANWKKNIPLAYGELMEEFEKCFGFVVPKSTDVKLRTIPGLPAPVNLVTVREPHNPDDIMQTDWSDGMLRFLCLLTLPATRFPQAQGQPLRPSLVFIDEIENGLDFKTLKRLISYYLEHSNITQTMVASHSPLVCNMISPRNWKVARRDGAKVAFSQPNETERDLEGERQHLLLDNWEFYQRNVATKKTADGN